MVTAGEVYRKYDGSLFIVHCVCTHVHLGKLIVLQQVGKQEMIAMGYKDFHKHKTGVGERFILVSKQW